MVPDESQTKIFSEENLLKLKKKRSRDIYSKLKNVIQSFGNFDTFVTSQQIVFSKTIPFFYVQTKSFRSLDFFFILDRKAYHKAINRIEGPVGVLYIHCLKLRSLSDIDGELIQLLREAYREDSFPLKAMDLNDFRVVADEEHQPQESFNHSRYMVDNCVEFTH
ncbi:MAG: hypothetical protein JXR70_18000 [Spirochaetales bacterium]|nr:hypothetical protein [Spirochaetales bacterium]